MQEFRTESDYPMILAEEAWRAVADRLRPLPPVSMGLEALLGLVVAEDVASDEDLPPFAASTMDGYALIAADSATRRRVVGEQDAGEMADLSLEPGTAMRIMTGAPLPAGADAVIPVEDTQEHDGWVTLRCGVRPGENVRPVGSDLAAGQTVLRAGMALGPAEIGLLASIGRAEALVHPRPVVTVAATGNELVDVGEALAPGQIRDSNSYALCAATAQAGGIPRRTERIPDTYEALKSALAAAAGSSDVLLTSGGVSMGTRDLVKPVLEELGTVHFGRVAIKPGKPLTYATIERQGGRICHFFGLPGNPVSSLVTFEMYVRPVLRLLMGHKTIWRPEVETRLSHRVRHEADRTEYQRAVLDRRDGTYWASTTGSQASSRLMSLRGANALLVIPQGIGDLEPEAIVRAVLVDLPEVSDER